MRSPRRAGSAIAAGTHHIQNHTEKVPVMKKTLFAIKNLVAREKSLKDYAWYIWY